jgi:thiol-disulfide isomerase/thioredoxin
MSARILRAAVTALLLALSVPAAAAEFRDFDAGSMRGIRAEQAGKPFLLVFWSLYCEPCREEMSQWGELQRRHPGVAIILVATDPPQERVLMGKFLARHKLGKVQSWAFADEFSERVRHSVDTRWRGELPRTYFYDRDHKAEARSGKVDAATASGWLARAQGKRG